MGFHRAVSGHTWSQEVNKMPTWFWVLLVVLLVLALFGGYGYNRR